MNENERSVKKKMSEERLIDANDVYEIIGQTGVARIHVADIDQIKRIDPETLPIVRELRENLKRVTAERDVARRDCAVAESNYFECLAQLAEARVRLKSAITDMEALMWHSGDGCNICKHCVEVHREPYVRLDCDLGSGCNCKPEWRGVTQ